jgi:hypothetical protein
MNRVYEITDWAFVFDGEPDPYMAPEAMETRLTGLCPERSAQRGFAPEEGITSSCVNEWDREAGIVKTASGSTYRLRGKPHPDFADYCNRQGKPVPEYA